MFRKKKPLTAQNNRLYPPEKPPSTEEVRKSRTRAFIVGFLDRPHFPMYYLEVKALQIASRLPQTGKTKEELLALGYRQLLPQVTKEDALTEITGSYTSKEFWEVCNHYERQRIMDAFRMTIKNEIERLEKPSRVQRQFIKSRSDQLTAQSENLNNWQKQQETRRKEIKEQREAVQAKLKALKYKLEGDYNPPRFQPHKPDLDRLEAMLEQLRRLKK